MLSVRGAKPDLTEPAFVQACNAFLPHVASESYCKPPIGSFVWLTFQRKRERCGTSFAGFAAQTDFRKLRARPSQKRLPSEGRKESAGGRAQRVAKAAPLPRSFLFSECPFSIKERVSGESATGFFTSTKVSVAAKWVLLCSRDGACLDRLLDATNL